jgi:tetratricopeptide (TPR) repeat protein
VDLAPADALFDAGCYRCLQQAFEVYERALAHPQPPARARDAAFAAALLLALREKELGLAATPWLDRAATLARPEERIYLDIAASLPWTSAGAATDFEPRRAQASERTAWRAFLDWPPASSREGLSIAGRHPILDQYLSLALACADGSKLAPQIENGVDVTRPAIRYRLGICGAARRAHLEAVAAADPRFVEALFFIGRYEMATGVSPQGGGLRPSRVWLTTAVPPLAAAHEGLPDAPIVATVFAGLMRSRTDLTRALALYDTALAARPSQRDALLGRAITLTFLARRDEAIDTATRMIDLGTWYVGAAYYWRALNRYRLSDLELAAVDVGRAKQLQLSDEVLTLSGMIAYEQKRQKDARADFNAAVTLNQANCAAQWYLGLLDLEDETWPPAVTRFSTAAVCYQNAVEALRAEAAQLPPDLPDEARERQMAGFEESIDSSQRQAGRSFLNASLASLRAGDRAAAAGYARSAAAYPEVKDRADSLVRSLEPR